ncbi:MAG: AAA family ATPase [Saprospiraceae bacterium]
MKKGLLPGKFMPLHRGHEFLITAARQRCDELVILVFSSETDPIPGWQRYAWVLNTFPDLDVRHVVDELPTLECWPAAMPKDTTIFFESGNHYTGIAEKQGFKHEAIDPQRDHFSITTSAIRQHPHQHWELLAVLVRPYYIRRIALLGPESSGKSYLTELLANHFNTVFVEEYGRTYCEKFGMDLTELDFAHIAGGQLYREDEMALQANQLLFCDTDLIITQAWSEIYFQGRCQPWILWADHTRRYDLFLLLKPDIPWQNDGLREYEDQRESMFLRLQQELESRGLPHVVISGGFEERTRRAVEAVDKLNTGTT